MKLAFIASSLSNRPFRSLLTRKSRKIPLKWALSGLGAAALLIGGGIGAAHALGWVGRPAADAGMLDPNAVVSSATEKTVVDAVGKIPGLTDVYITRTYDGRYVVVGTADLGQSSTSQTQTGGESSNNGSSTTSEADAAVAMQWTEQFVGSVYRLSLPIADATLTVTRDGSYVASASLGEKEAAAAEGKHFTWPSPQAFSSWLESYNHEDTDLENNTFYYTADTVPG